MDGVGFALAGSLVDMFSYRAEASGMCGVSVALADGGSSDDITAVLVNASVAELATAALLERDWSKVFFFFVTWVNKFGGSSESLTLTAPSFAPESISFFMKAAICVSVTMPTN